MNKELERLNRVIDFLKSENIIHKQSDIAEHLGYSRQGTISEIVNGKKPITSKFLKAFCFNYGVSEQFIKTGKGDIFDKVYHAERLGEPKFLSSMRKWVIKKTVEMDEADQETDHLIGPFELTEEQVKILNDQSNRDKQDLINENIYLKQLRVLLTEKVVALESLIKQLSEENKSLRDSVDKGGIGVNEE